MKHELKLSAEPDGFGFFYGWAERNGERVRVDMLPRDHLWRGDIKLEGQKPDARAWILYLDGEEFARVVRALLCGDCEVRSRRCKTGSAAPHSRRNL